MISTFGSLAASPLPGANLLAAAKTLPSMVEAFRDATRRMPNGGREPSQLDCPKSVSAGSSDYRQRLDLEASLWAARQRAYFASSLVDRVESREADL